MLGWLNSLQHFCLKIMHLEKPFDKICLTRTILKEVFQVHNNYIKDLLGFKDVKVKKVESNDFSITIHLETIKKEQICPCCNETTSKIHDYRYQTIKDAPFQFKNTFIKLRKRRYKCKHCGKQFFENLNFLPKYYRMTNKLAACVCNKFRTTNSIKQIASETNLSSNTIYRLLALFNVSNNNLPEALSIDEFKGNTGYSKYQVALMNSDNKKVLDILPSRRVHDLCQYFKKFPSSEREKVKYFVTDLWEDYKGIAMTYFPKAKVIADRFHFVRYACNAMDKIRIRVQKEMPKSTRKYIKGSKKLLMARPFNLKEKGFERVSYLLNNFHDDLRTSYLLKEQLLDIVKLPLPALAKKLFKEWIESAENTNIPELIECTKTYRNWFIEISNSFYVPFNNGGLEGTNNKIKVLKRCAYGYKNFDHFKARILLCTK